MTAISPNSTTTTNSNRHFRPCRKNNNRFNSSTLSSSPTTFDENGGSKNHNYSNTSAPILRSKSNSHDSIADFDESEWTPPDSSYGAACPVCGFIPKHVRQMIEMSMIAGMVFLLIYLLVTTSMKIADAHQGADGGMSGNVSAADRYFSANNHTGTVTNVETDDDVYVEYSNNANDDGGAENGDDVALYDEYVDDYNYHNNLDDGYGNSASAYYQNYNSNPNYNNYDYNNNRNNGYNDDYYRGGRGEGRQR